MHYSMNPLGADLWLVWDIIALIITFAFIQALVLINSQFQKRELLPTYITRKIIHIFAAPLFVVCWLLYSGSGASRVDIFSLSGRSGSAAQLDDHRQVDASGAMVGKLAALQPAREAISSGLSVHILSMIKAGNLTDFLEGKEGIGTSVTN